ncbi:MAG TPA: glycosyltransferase [Gaiellaceae bacterium]|nr:glycosyltransferase [Gaiellaceae bacterium]
MTAAVRLLVVAFFFPPAGGGGVQRTLKFCKYLPESGIDVHVLAPDDPKWLVRDEGLLEAIPPETTVHRAPFRGPAAVLRSEAIRERRGLARAAAEARLLPVRLLPDRASMWAPAAARAALRIVRRERIDVLLTTSPPNSMHAVGAFAGSRARVPWVADFRDPWLASAFRGERGPHVRAKRAAETRLARAAVRRAAALTCVTETIAGELARFDPAAPARTTVIGNGADLDDFTAFEHRRNERFTLVHAGSFIGSRSLEPVLTAVKELEERRPELRGTIRVRFVGDLREADRARAGALDVPHAWEETGHLTYAEALRAQREADALLLLIPHASGHGPAIVSGKVFEYVAARRPILAVVPPGGAAAALVRGLGGGPVADPADVTGIAAALEGLVDEWRAGGLPDRGYPAAELAAISRRERARELAAVLERVTRAGDA